MTQGRRIHINCVVLNVWIRYRSVAPRHAPTQLIWIRLYSQQRDMRMLHTSICREKYLNKRKEYIFSLDIAYRLTKSGRFARTSRKRFETPDKGAACPQQGCINTSMPSFSSSSSLEHSSACCSHSRKGSARRRSSSAMPFDPYFLDGLAAHSMIAFSSTMSSSYSSCKRYIKSIEFHSPLNK